MHRLLYFSTASVMANPTLERKIQRLLELGVSRSAAKSALKASKLDVEEVRERVISYE